MIARYAYLLLRNRRFHQLMRGAARARQTQQEVLLEKIRRNADSDFGRDHSFSEIRSVADFRRNVPISDYEYFRPYIDRVKRGETHALFGPGTELIMFALTSGTTASSKFIPITREFFQEYREGWNLWGIRNYIDHLDLLRKQTLQLTSDWQQFHTEAGIPCGNISGFAASTAPLVSRLVFLLPHCLITIPDSKAKQYTALRIAVANTRVGQIISANPSTLVEFAKLADVERETLIRDIHDGTLSDRFEVPDEVRSKIRRRIRRKNPRRARFLENLVEEKGRMLPRDFWPKISVLSVWTGGSVGAYLPQLEEYYGTTVFRDHGLSASEGRMTLPYHDATCAGILEYWSTFFEFIPEHEHNNENPTVLEAHELEEGQNYFIVLTTSSGLYRYDIHDVVRCVGYQGEAPLLEFLNKGSSFASVTGEKLSEFQVVSAVKQAFAELDMPIEQFTLAPVMGDPPGYQLLMESSANRVDDAKLASRINELLAELNWEYASKLQSHRLLPVQVRELPQGTWQKFQQKRLARRGASLEQYKHPALVGDLDFVDSLLETPNRVAAAS